MVNEYVTVLHYIALDFIIVVCRVKKGWGDRKAVLVKRTISLQLKSMAICSASINSYT